MEHLGKGLVVHPMCDTSCVSEDSTQTVGFQDGSDQIDNVIKLIKLWVPGKNQGIDVQ